jgi:hypothetical protein
MTTLPPPSTKGFPDDSVEKQVYNIVDKYKENIPIVNDRNRLGYCLFKFVMGEGDNPEILVKSTKIKIVGISEKDLAAKLNTELKDLKK